MKSLHLKLTALALLLGRFCIGDTNEVETLTQKKIMKLEICPLSNNWKQELDCEVREHIQKHINSKQHLDIVHFQSSWVAIDLSVCFEADYGENAYELWGKKFLARVKPKHRLFSNPELFEEDRASGLQIVVISNLTSKFPVQSLTPQESQSNRGIMETITPQKRKYSGETIEFLMRPYQLIEWLFRQTRASFEEEQLYLKDIRFRRWDENSRGSEFPSHIDPEHMMISFTIIGDGIIYGTEKPLPKMFMSLHSGRARTGFIKRYNLEHPKEPLKYQNLPPKHMSPPNQTKRLAVFSEIISGKPPEETSKGPS